MMQSSDLIQIVYYLIIALPVILFSLSVHEFAHAYVSYKLGDPTAERAGRLRLNPLVHLDPIGTGLLFLTMTISIMSGGFFAFGWAKPVPINPNYYRGDPLRGIFQVGLAGPLANLALGALFGLGLRLASAYSTQEGLFLLLSMGLGINLSLFLFNLIPVPPLDGSKIIAFFLRGPSYRRYLQMQHYGTFILLILIVTRLLDRLIVPPLNFLIRLFAGG